MTERMNLAKVQLYVSPANLVYMGVGEGSILVPLLFLIGIFEVVLWVMEILWDRLKGEKLDMAIDVELQIVQFADDYKNVFIMADE